MEEQIQKLYVEVSSRCNLRCKMCFRHSWVGERFGDLDPAVFARMMDEPVPHIKDANSLTEIIQGILQKRVETGPSIASS